MAIRKTSQRHLNQPASSGAGVATFVGEEPERFANDAVNVIGRIALGREGQARITAFGA